jgi:hypothetical protein
MVSGTEILTAVTRKVHIFWDATPCGQMPVACCTFLGLDTQTEPNGVTSRLASAVTVGSKSHRTRDHIVTCSTEGRRCLATVVECFHGYAHHSVL